MCIYCKCIRTVDMLCCCIYYRWGLCLLEAIQTVEKRQSEVNWPFITLHGDADHLCDVEGSKKLYEVAQSTDKDIKVRCS